MHDAEFLSALHDNAADVLGRECPPARVLDHIDGSAPFDETLWQTIAGLGWPMLAVAEAQGGMADGTASLALVQEALGRCCAPLPFMGTALLATTLVDWPGEAQSGPIAAGIAQGTVTGGIGDLFGAPGLTAKPVDAGFVLSGETVLFDAIGSDWIVVPVAAGGSAIPALALLQTASLSLERRPVADRTRTVAALKVDGLTIPAGQLLIGEASAPVLHRLRTAAMLLTAADALGGAAALLDLTVEYLKTRSQFGKPIGSFQALKHRIADCRTELEMARALVTAARACGDDDPRALELAAMARLSACEAYHRIAREAVQMHGGIGYTWEHQVHVYLKRAALDRALWGGPAGAQDLIAACLMERAA